MEGYIEGVEHSDIGVCLFADNIWANTVFACFFVCPDQFEDIRRETLLLQYCKLKTPLKPSQKSSLTSSLKSSLKPQ